MVVAHDTPPRGSWLMIIHRRGSWYSTVVLGVHRHGYDQGGSKNGWRTLKIFWEDWYAREISRFVCTIVLSWTTLEIV